MALKRFVGERGAPDQLVSDNAKTFLCANKKLQFTLECLVLLVQMKWVNSLSRDTEMVF